MANHVRKRRERRQVLGELSANYAERTVLRCGFSVQRTEEAGRITLAMFTYTADGSAEDGQVFLVPKGTDDLKRLGEQENVYVEFARAEAELWLAEPMPCMLVLYDAQDERAYWSYLQAEFRRQKALPSDSSSDVFTISVDRRNVMNEDAVLQFVRYRDAVMSQMERMIRHRA